MTGGDILSPKIFAKSPAYLESTKESNVPYYLRFGFDVTGEITIPDGGPTMWQMWRRPG